ncbi:alpha-ketoglutarate-dependent dioxygenase AlkB [Shewanella sp. MBTL60-007]|uniref:alpha-ketoglutarate-dependent dioxygenase AlkB family protein n=1 Tax=Shewanella sp. MBTL60-007 TaxID=2815911 RepID=UPI001BBF023E|nr:alpha-ketoglutarate-dependent dioxygenase AlkB [Shewanella sp. MBTL60-007]GIU28671.1 2OG-Fe(II) oxygenase [Shewanella sp. MBTL60-007]
MQQEDFDFDERAQLNTATPVESSPAKLGSKSNGPSPLDKLPYTLIKGYLNLQQQQALLNESLYYDFTRPQVSLFGKSHPIPRSQVWFADKGCDYLYSGLFIQAAPWPKYAYKLRLKLARDFGLIANGVLVNRYADGNESMGWHSDDEPEIEPGSDIASVTLGASRDFFIRHKTTRQKVCLKLDSGDLLIMHWPMQSLWEHSLPRRLKEKQARVNYTFRRLILGFHQGENRRLR